MPNIGGTGPFKRRIILAVVTSIMLILTRRIVLSVVFQKQTAPVLQRHAQIFKCLPHLGEKKSRNVLLLHSDMVKAKFRRVVFTFIDFWKQIHPIRGNELAVLSIFRIWIVNCSHLSRILNRLLKKSSLLFIVKIVFKTSVLKYKKLLKDSTKRF